MIEKKITSRKIHESVILLGTLCGRFYIDEPSLGTKEFLTFHIHFTSSSTKSINLIEKTPKLNSGLIISPHFCKTK
jgi:hypothetical protein